MADDTAPTADQLIEEAQRRQAGTMPTVTVTAPATTTASPDAIPPPAAPTAASLIADAAKRSQVGTSLDTDTAPPASVNGDSIAPGLRATIATTPGYRYGQIWPLKQNLDTGTFELAWPGMAHQFANGVLDLAEGPITGNVTPEGTAALTSMTPAGAVRRAAAADAYLAKTAATNAEKPGILSDAFKTDPISSAIPPSDAASVEVAPGMKVPTGGQNTTPMPEGATVGNAVKIAPPTAPITPLEQSFLDAMHSQIAPWAASSVGSTIGTGLGALAGGPIGALAGTVAGMPAGMAFKALLEKYGPDVARSTVNLLKTKVIDPLNPYTPSGPNILGAGPVRMNPIYTVPAAGGGNPTPPQPYTKEIGNVGIPGKSLERPYYPDPRSTVTPSREGNPLVPSTGPVFQPDPNPSSSWWSTFFHNNNNPLLLPSRAPTA